jgi:hypothetical protein
VSPTAGLDIAVPRRKSPRSCWELNPGHSACSLVTIQTELLQLTFVTVKIQKIYFLQNFYTGLRSVSIPSSSCLLVRNIKLKAKYMFSGHHVVVLCGTYTNAYYCMVTMLVLQTCEVAYNGMMFIPSFMKIHQLIHTTFARLDKRNETVSMPFLIKHRLGFVNVI